MARRAIDIQALEVSQVVRYLDQSMAADEVLQDIWVRGEVSNFHRHSSGHWYFSLKDERSVLRCAMFRQAAQFAPNIRDGAQIIARGGIGMYESRGEVQLKVSQIQDIGTGLLFERLLALKIRLEAQGWLAAERKRPIPQAPRTIGVVTSSGAAALRDIIRTLRLRWPLARVVLAAAQVQGDGAARQIAGAIDALNQHHEAEVIVVARGGGSIEDLWAFNEEIVAMAIARSEIPVVTGVGHETDFTIADFVADLRAATPTAAASAVSPDVRGIRIALAEEAARLGDTMASFLAARRDELDVATRQLAREHPRAQADRARRAIAGAHAALASAWQHRAEIERERLSGSALRLQALSPLLTIARGYATITRDRDGQPLTTIAGVTPPERVTIRLADGVLGATVHTVSPS